MSTRLAFQTQLASIMEVLANAAVAEICKLVDDDYAVVSLQMSQCQRENKALKRKLHLLELKMARGSAERRLRESALNSSRPGGRAHVNITDKYRGGPSTSSGSVFDRQMNMGLWPDGSSTTDPISEPMHPVPLRPDETVDVQVVEQEAMLVKEERMDDALAESDHIALIGEDGVVECGPRGGGGPSPPEPPPAMAQSSEPLPQPQQPQPGPRTRTQPSGRSRGLEGAGAEQPGEEDPDVLLIKVEDLEEGLRTAGQGGLSIQEGLVESSTDDYRAAIPLDDGLALANQLAEPEGTRRSLSEVSYGHHTLSYDASSANQMWSGNGDGCDDDCVVVPGTSSLSQGFPPAPPPMRAGLSAGPEAQGGRGFAMEHAGSFSAALSVAGGLGGFMGPMAGSDQGQGQGQERYTNGRKKAERKRLYLCRFCGKGFSAPANLEPHLRTHTGERPYGCTVCGKHFSQVWNLKIHMNVHTGERPYQCPRCPERFADPSNLKKHQKRHHPAAPDQNQNQQPQPAL